MTDRRPIEDVHVLDVGNNIAGPCVATVLAGLGATVTKIERPVHGDDSRKAPPYLGRAGVKLRGPSADDADVSVGYLKRNRGKSSVTIDLRDPEEAHRFHALVKDADVLVENFRPGTLARLGYDFDRLHALNPSLIICSVTGFGQSGPLAGWAAYDTVVRAISGHGESDFTNGLAMADWSAALYGAIGILGALNRRHVDGNGARIDVSMLETWMSLAWESNLDLAERLSADGSTKSPMRRVAPWSNYDAADGRVFVCAYNDRQWAALKEIVDIDDSRFDTSEGRLDHADELDALITAWTSTRLRWEIAQRLQDAGVPSAPVLAADETKDNPQVQARGILSPLRHSNPHVDATMPDSLLCAEFPLWIDGLGHLTYPMPAPELGSANDDWSRGTGTGISADDNPDDNETTQQETS